MNFNTSFNHIAHDEYRIGGSLCPSESAFYACNFPASVVSFCSLRFSTLILAFIFNAGDGGGRLFKTNRNFFLPHLLNLITFATSFQYFIPHY